MHLYSLTLQEATAINHVVPGSFSAPKADELCVSKGKIVQLLKVEPESGKLEVLYSQEMFGLIRSMIAFKLIGMQKHYLVIGSDSGRIVILEFDQN